MIYNFLKVCPKCGVLMIETGAGFYCPACDYILKI